MTLTPDQQGGIPGAGRRRWLLAMERLEIESVTCSCGHRLGQQADTGRHQRRNSPLAGPVAWVLLREARLKAGICVKCRRERAEHPPVLPLGKRLG